MPQTTFVPSEYQKAIFDFIVEGKGDAMVSAVAGSGKTTTLVEGAKYLSTQSAVFFAFNKHIAEELSRRLVDTPMKARTIHSLGYSMVAQGKRGLKTTDYKYVEIARRYCETNWPELAFKKAQLSVLTNSLAKLVDLARCTLTYDSRGLEDLADAHGIELDNGVLQKVISLVPLVLNEGIAVYQRSNEIDFTDMVWLPTRLGLIPLDRYEWIFVDEAQDLNAAQRELVLKVRGAGGRILWVGDPRQAIMGFAGADFQSYRRIQEITGAVELPLSICYRCPTSHIELAQAIVPEIQPAPGAAVGEVAFITKSKLHELVRENDLITCRLVAPCVSMCIDLIRRKVPARVRGRDVASQLVALATKIGKYADWSEFPMLLDVYYDERLAALNKRRRPSESQILMLTDTVEALHACYAEFRARDVDDFCKQIRDIFSDDRASVTLSTIHKAKGLEADRVFILRPEKLPLVWQRQTDDQYEQEMNLKYVALTRAKQLLVWVTEDEGKKETEEEKEVVANEAVAPTMAL
jgi:DNA helicase-2/ATP-dependent DNA helicase PcrA